MTVVQSIVQNVISPVIGSIFGGDANPNLVVNGDFDTDVSGWTAFNSTIAWSAGRLLLTSIDGGFDAAYQTISGLSPGDQYDVSIELEAVSGSIRAAIYDTAVGSGNLLNVGTETGGPTVHEGTFIAPADGEVTFSIYITTATDSGYIDSVSVKKN